MKCRILLAAAAMCSIAAWSFLADSAAAAPNTNTKATAKANPGPKATPKASPSPTPDPNTGKPDKVDAANATDAVYKAVVLAAGNFQNFPHIVVKVTPVLGGATVQLVIPNDKNDPKKPDPDNTIHNVLKNAKPEDLLEIKVGKIGQTPAIVSASKYNPKPYEEQPNVVFFQAKVSVKPTAGAKEDRPAIEVTKFLQTETVLVPQKSVSGKMVPDPDILAKIDSLKANDTLELQVDKQDGKAIIKSVDVFVPPTRMEFVKIARDTVDGKPLVGVEVKDKSGASQTIMIDPAGKDAAALNSKLANLVTGNDVLVKSKTDARGTWLTLLEAAPKDKPKAKDN